LAIVGVMVAGNVISWFRKASTCTNGATLGTMSCSSYMVTQAGCACARRAGAVHAANAAATAAALVRNSRRPFWLIAFLPRNSSLVRLRWQLLIDCAARCIVKKHRRRSADANYSSTLPLVAHCRAASAPGAYHLPEPGLMEDRSPAIRAAGAQFIRLPKHLPDLSPIKTRFPLLPMVV